MKFSCRTLSLSQVIELSNYCKLHKHLGVLSWSPKCLLYKGYQILGGQLVKRRTAAGIFYSAKNCPPASYAPALKACQNTMVQNYEICRVSNSVLFSRQCYQSSLNCGSKIQTGIITKKDLSLLLPSSLLASQFTIKRQKKGNTNFTVYPRP